MVNNDVIWPEIAGTKLQQLPSDQRHRVGKFHPIAR
jgi:hypothetical protein